MNIRQEYPLATGSVVIFLGEEIRQTPTGVHGRVTVGLRQNGRAVALAFDTFNLSRLGERVKLANAAHTALGQLDRQAFPNPEMRRALDAFCHDAWSRWLADQNTVTDLRPRDEPVSYLLRPYIIASSGTILFGPGGSGKTYLAMIWARCMEGLCDLWPVARPARVLFVQLERSERTFARRVHLVNRALGIDPETPMRTLVARGRSLQAVAPIIEDEVQRNAVDVVMLDSISRAGAGGLVKDETANAIMDTLNAIAPAWVGVAHTSHEGKEQEQKAHVYGSIHFENAADVCVQVSAEPDGTTLGLMLQKTKANDLPLGDPEYLALLFNEAGLDGVRPARREEFLSLPDIERGRLPERMLEVLVREGEKTTQALSTMFSRPYGTIARILWQDKRFVRTRKEGREQFWGAAAKT